MIGNHWYTADSLKKGFQIPSWEKSFNCISEGFLELTDDEKNESVRKFIKTIKIVYPSQKPELCN